MQCPNCKQSNCVDPISREKIKSPTLKDIFMRLPVVPCVAGGPFYAAMHDYIHAKFGYSKFVEKYVCKNCGHDFQVMKDEKIM